MNIAITDYVGVHTLDPNYAAQIGLASSDGVVAASAECGRRSLLDIAYAKLVKRAPRIQDGGTFVIKVGQSPGMRTDLFGAHQADDFAYLERDHLLVSSACASGIAALVLAESILAVPTIDRVLLIGASVPNPGDHASFTGVGALTTDRVRPFDEMADGTLLGRFGAALIIERQCSTRVFEQLQTILILGTGAKTTGLGAISKSEDQLDVMLQATLKTLPRTPTLIIAHATGTKQGDLAEAIAIETAARTAWKSTVAVMSQKGLLGHAVHAAGFASIVGACEALRTSRMPGTVGLVEPIVSSLNINFLKIGSTAVLDRNQSVLVNGFGFGGNNYSVHLGLSLPEEN